jgi:GT2 family glycosyltransferase
LDKYPAQHQANHNTSITTTLPTTLSAGIKAARAKYVVLVNSDLLVAKGWLYALWTTHTDNKHVGIAGPMMLGDQHLITEAGGVVWKDASAANYGRGLTHSRHEVRLLAGIRCCCASCISAAGCVLLCNCTGSTVKPMYQCSSCFPDKRAQPFSS